MRCGNRMFSVFLSFTHTIHIQYISLPYKTSASALEFDMELYNVHRYIEIWSLHCSDGVRHNKMKRENSEILRIEIKTILTIIYGVCVRRAWGVRMYMYLCVSICPVRSGAITVFHFDTLHCTSEFRFIRTFDDIVVFLLKWVCVDWKRLSGTMEARRQWTSKRRFVCGRSNIRSFQNRFLFLFFPRIKLKSISFAFADKIPSKSRF